MRIQTKTIILIIYHFISTSLIDTSHIYKYLAVKMQEPDKELKKIEELEEQVNIALKRSRQLDDSQKFDEQFFKQELKEMQERCFQNQQTMLRLEQKYMKPADLKSSDIQSQSPLQKSSIKQRNLLEQKNAQILELQKKLLDQDRSFAFKLQEEQIRAKQLEGENASLKDQLSKCEGIELQRALEDLQKQYLDLQEKLQDTMRCDQSDYQQLKQEYEEYQLLTQNIVNQEEEYQRRICELEEELQQSHSFQQELMSRLSKNEEIFQQRYRELKQKYQQQLDDQRHIMDQQIDELREQNNYLFGQLQTHECKIQQLEFDLSKKENESVSRSKSFSACGGMNVRTLQDCESNKRSYLYQNTGAKPKPLVSNQCSQLSQAKPVKQINISIEKENFQTDLSYSKTRSYSKEQPITYKQVAEQRQAILYSKLPKPRR